MSKPLPQLRFQKRCWCGQLAVTVKTIRHVRRTVTRLYDLTVRNRFWGDLVRALRVIGLHSSGDEIERHRIGSGQQRPWVLE